MDYSLNKKNYFLAIMMAIFLSSFGSYAGEIPKEEFCRSLTTIVNNQSKSKQLTVLQAFQILYLTRTIIKPEEITANDFELN
jgi:hypothetical protein